MISFKDKNNKTLLKILNMILFWKTILTILILINYNSLINLVCLIIKKLKIIKKIKVFFQRSLQKYKTRFDRFKLFRIYFKFIIKK